MEYYGIHYDSIIEHHGILGMKWGVRRYQNADGTLTAKGKKRYAKVASSPRLTKAETRGAIHVKQRHMIQQLKSIVQKPKKPQTPKRFLNIVKKLKEIFELQMSLIDVLNIQTGS